MTTMTTDTTHCRDTGNSTAAFLASYAARLIASGATCIRLEKNVGRLAKEFGFQADISVMPRHIHLSLSDPDGNHIITAMAAVETLPVSFNIITRLSRLSWEVSDRHLTLDDTRLRFKAIMESDRAHALATTLLVAVSNAAFCGLFGGDLTAMAIVAIATLAGFRLKSLLTSKKVDFRVVAFLCAVVSSVLGATGLLFQIGTTPHIALGASVLYLVPGIAFLNSFSDMIYRHYLFSLYRFADAAVITCCLSAGLCTGMALMHTGMF